MMMTMLMAAVLQSRLLFRSGVPQSMLLLAQLQTVARQASRGGSWGSMPAYSDLFPAQRMRLFRRALGG